MPKEAEKTSPVRAGYIVGVGKSGSTLLSRALGQVNGLIDVGESIHLALRAGRDGLCGCGKRFFDCDFRAQFVGKSVGGVDNLNQSKWRHLESRYMLELFLCCLGLEPLRHFPDRLAVYTATLEAAGVRVIVDSSGAICQAMMLSTLYETDTHAVHLIWDSRASENSMPGQRTSGGAKMRRRGPWANSLSSALSNGIAGRYGERPDSKYLRVCCEDFVNNPRRVLSEVLAVAEIEHDDLDITDHGAVTPSPGRSLSGSAVRFETGGLQLELYERWKQSPPRYNWWVVSHAPCRVRKRNGYS